MTQEEELHLYLSALYYKWPFVKEKVDGLLLDYPQGQCQYTADYVKVTAFAKAVLAFLDND